MLSASPSVKMYTVFVAASITLGNWYPRIADVQERLALDATSLGQSLAGLPFGIMLGFSLLARIVHRSGFRRVYSIGTPVLALSLIAAALAPSGIILFLALMVAGAAQGALGIAGNVEAHRMETALAKPVLVRGHGFWSLATLIGGAMAAGFKALGVEPFLHFAIVLPMSLALLWFGLKGFSPSPERRGKAMTAPVLVLPTLPIFGLFLAGGVVLYLDSAASDWSVILMRDALGSSAFLSGLAFTAWALGQTTGRLLHPTLAARIPPTPMALGFLVAAAAGVSIIAITPGAALTILGFVLLGLGTSSMLPMALSAAAQLAERAPAANVASLSQLAFLVSALSPLIIGLVVGYSDIRLAFLLGLAVLAISAGTVLIRRPFG
jgi:MFS family permease